MLNLFDVLLLRKFGGGSSITVEPLTVTSNGTQTAPEGKAYSPVTVNVPNPVRSQVVVGTLENPFGGLNYSELEDAIASREATAILMYEFNGSAGQMFLDSLGNGYIYGSAAGIRADIASSEAVNISWSNNGSFQYARAIMGGNIVDMSAYAPSITSYLRVIWHPLG